MITTWVPPNTQKNLQQLAEQGPQKGVKYHVQMFLVFCDFLRSVGEHIFGSIAGGDWFPRGLNFKLKNFALLHLQKHEFLDPFLAGQFSAKNAL